MNTANMMPEPKKLVGKLVRICLTCGQYENISSNKYTILCKACDTLNFYKGEGQ